MVVPDIPGLRPTPSKVRQALFNILGDVHGLTTLDLFAGSGIMALEALSRGVASAISVDQNRKAIRAMQQRREHWHVEHWQLIPRGVEEGLTELASQHFDLIFADPPYAAGISEQLPLWLDQSNIGCGRLVIEESSKYSPHWPQGWQLQQSRPYGATCLHFLTRD